jgi:hypothetical protein
MPRSRQDWWRVVLLGGARFVLAVIIFGTAVVLSRSWFSGLDRMPVWFVMAASAVVAAVFWVIRRPLEAVVDRLVLGDRAGGYAAVRTLLQRMATTLPVDEVVPALAETAGRTVHSSRAEVRLNMSDGDAWSQVWPPRAVADGSPVTVEVRHAGAEVGEIQVDVTEPDESDRDRRLLDDLARPAGLALSTVRLTLELRRRAAELEGLTTALELSNRRIMLARESELARIDAEMQERVMPFIDRARAALVASPGPSGAGGGVRSDSGIGDTGGRAAGATGIATAGAEVAGALDALRVLARGIYPPRLADAGLAVSLEGWQQRSGTAVDVHMRGDEEVLHGHEELESCLYFSLVTVLGSLSAGSERPVAVVEIGITDVAWQVRGTAGSTGNEQALQVVRDRVEAFDGTMRVDDAMSGRVTVRATVRMADPPAATLISGQVTHAGSAGPVGSGATRSGVGWDGGVGPATG